MAIVFIFYFWPEQQELPGELFIYFFHNCINKGQYKYPYRLTIWAILVDIPT